MLSNPIYYPYPALKRIENGDFLYIWYRPNFLLFPKNNSVE